MSDYVDMDKLRAIASLFADIRISGKKEVIHDDNEFVASGTYLGEVVPKERPRKGAAGNMYTPPKTRAFEAAVAKWGGAVFDAPCSVPVRVDLVIFDETDDSFLIDASLAGLAFNDHGDLDNYEKAICDALNKIAWTDDKKIVYKNTTRRYAATAGFKIEVRRYGLAKHELLTLRRLMGVK